ncbi:MAG: carbohydrate ABC transporter permease [Aggregatilineales bacterium]
MLMNEKSARFLKLFSTYFLLIAIAVVTAFPFFWMVMTSFKNQREVFTQFLPSSFDLSSYQQVINTTDLPVHLGNSIYVSAINIAVVLITATLAGYVFARFKFPGSNWLFYAFLLAMMIPGQAILIPMFQYLKSLNLLNTHIGLALSMTGGAISFATFLLRAFFKSLPSELGDAAKLDGCSEWGVFRFIYLPLARPGLATVLIFQFMGVWNEFMFSTTFISTPALKTIQPAVYQVVGRYSVNYPALTAGLLLAILPVMLVFLVLQGQFIKGLTAGAFKGA